MDCCACLPAQKSSVQGTYLSSIPLLHALRSDNKVHPSPGSVMVLTAMDNDLRRNAVRELERIGGFHGMAVSHDGSLLALGEGRSHVSVYSLPDGRRINKFGNPGNGELQFRYPQKLCFLPNGHLVVADGSERLQEVTVNGEHVRFIGDGVFHAEVRAVAANDEFVAAARFYAATGEDSVLLFNIATGDVVRSIGTVGDAPTDVSSCVHGLAFSHRDSLLLAEVNWVTELSLYGEFVRRIQVPLRDLCVSDVVCTREGIVITCFGIDGDRADHTCITAYTEDSDGSTPAFRATLPGRVFIEDDSPEANCRYLEELMFYPNAMALHGTSLYVVDAFSGCVHVFE